MESIVFNMFKFLEEKIDHLFLFLMDKFMIYNGLLLVIILFQFQGPNQLQQLLMIKIVSQCLNLGKGTEAQLRFVLFQACYFWVDLETWPEKWTFGI